MKLLLDTNVFLRMMLEPSRLTPTMRSALLDPANEIFTSSICAWEIAIKMAIGKLSLSDPLDRFMSEGIRNAKAIGLPIRVSHAVRVHSLPLFHRDPFDRLLIAQGLVESLTIVTADRQFAAYGVPLIQ